MSIRGAASIVGAFEHPGRRLADVSTGQIVGDIVAGVLADAGLERDTVDGLFVDFSSGGFSAQVVGDYLGLRPRWMDTTDNGGSSYLSHVGHAAAAVAAGKCDVALVLMAAKAQYEGAATKPEQPELGFEGLPAGGTTVAEYAMVAARHMYEFGTTSADLAEIKAAASSHAVHNPHALLQKEVGVQDVLDSPLIADPLHRLDCCVVTDGGGAVLVVRPEIARALPRRSVTVLGHGEAMSYGGGGPIDLTSSAAVRSGPAAFAEAGIVPADVDYAGIYDSFTITVLMALEDLGFAEKGKGGRFVRDGGLRARGGRLPFNTDGGGLCNNHPGNRGGMPKIVEAVRQLRGEAHPEVQVPDCEIAIAHGNGGSLATRSGAATLVLGREDA